MPTYCKTWFYPEAEHRPLCQEEYRPLESDECPVCVTPFVPQPDCSNLPLGAFTLPNRAHCDYVPQGNAPLQYVRNFPRWLKVVVTPGELDGDPLMWPCVSSYYRGTFLCYNNSLCSDTWVSLGKGVVCSEIVNGQTVCTDNGQSSSPIPAEQWRIAVRLVYGSNSQAFWVYFNRYMFGCGTTQVTSSLYKTDETPSNNGWRFDCKATHEVKWLRSTNSSGQPIWIPFSSPSIIPNRGFSITISPV